MPEPAVRDGPAVDPAIHDAGITGVLVGFAHALRGSGLVVGTGDVLAYVEAMATLSPADLLDLYWAGRATLVSRRDDIPPYDRAFRAYFLGEDSPAADQLPLSPVTRMEAEATLVLPATDPGAPDEEQQEQRLGLMASQASALRHRSFAEATPDELAALRRIMRTIRLTPPRRRTRRTRPSSMGTIPDLKNTIRHDLRLSPAPDPLLYRRRKDRLRPLVLVLDISGSMADYSRALLQFAHATRRAAVRVEVFCFSTRLSRITRQLRTRNIDLALAGAGRVVMDWEGGTRIGAALAELLRRWGRGGMCRGAVVLICSDGLDRGDPELLAASMERLSRLAYRIVWLNPHKGHAREFRPSTVGMMVAAPHVDLLLSGHDLASLQELAARLEDL